jgi:hypothetical protein
MILTYPVALAGLSALTAGGIALAVLSGHPTLVWVVFPVVAVLTALFLWDYSKRPGPESRRPASADPEEDEPFEDPVEEADRAAAAGAADPRSPEPTGNGPTDPVLPPQLPDDAEVARDPAPATP